jgi:phosphoribosyl 1,2-cyclic phosphodiesterase
VWQGPIRLTRGTVLNVTFYGVRGSTPCSDERLARYGGNTACVVIDEPGQDPIVLDLGTGLRFYGLDGCGCPASVAPFRGTALVTHLHWDHVQGIPFFAPLLCDGAELDLYAPAQEGEPLADVVRGFLSPPYFPVEVDALPGEIRFHDTEPGSFRVGDALVTAAWVPHVGPTLGYRVELAGRSVAYVSDHQQPGVGSTEVDASVLELCRDVDVLIHDAQFDDDEFAQRSDWGHCTVEYAVEVAAQAGCRTLVLFHHDPSHHDGRVDELLGDARRIAAARGVPEVVAAHEGLTLALPPVAAPAPAAADATPSLDPLRGELGSDPVGQRSAGPASSPVAAAR